MNFKDLPVYKHKDEIVQLLEQNKTIIVESPTGSGKTTQLPLILLEAGYAVSKMVGVTQPRRIAALSVCDFVNKQMNSENNFASCKMRFYDTTNSNTRIKIMTDGILLQEIKTDPTLKDYSVLLIDEAHERSLNIDFILGLLKNLQAEREDLKVIISSATINTKRFSKFFNNCPIISIPTKIYPINTKYVNVKFEPRNTDKLFRTITEIVNFKIKLLKQNIDTYRDDILIFLPGEFHIKSCINEINYYCDSRYLEIYPLYGRLNKEEQSSVFNPTSPGKIKIVVATNIAETSITIDGIKTVIDSGMAKINFYNQVNYSSSLITQGISKSSAQQRKGRAGRTSPGFCYRLYSKDDYDSKQDYTTEEILRTDLSEVVLRMSDLGIYDFENFPFITRPKKAAIISAEKTLRDINAIDKERRLTNIGSLMVNFPLLPRQSRVIVEALINYPDVIDDILIAVSFLSVRTPFLFPDGQENEARNAQKNFNSEFGDFVSFLDIFHQFIDCKNLEERTQFCKKYFFDLQIMIEIVHVKDQLSDIVSELGFVLLNGGTIKEYLCCLASGLKQYICKRYKANVYRSPTIDRIYIHPASAWFKQAPEYILAGEIVNTSRMYARTVSPLKKEYLDLISPTLYNEINSYNKPEKIKGDNSKNKKNLKSNNKTINIYGKELNLLVTTNSRGKKEELLIINLEDLKFLYSRQKNARRHPQNYKSVLVYNNQYIHKGDTLFNIIDLYNKLPKNKIITKISTSVNYSADEIDKITSKFNCLLNLAQYNRKRSELGFIELVSKSENCFCYSINKDLFDSIANTSFSLEILKEKMPRDKQISRAYSKMLNLLKLE